MMVVNGATIRFRNKCRVELVSQARFLFGKQIMAEHEAETVIRQLYFRLQTAYVGPVEERPGATAAVHDLLQRLQTEARPDVSVAVGIIRDAIAAEDFYKALKLLRIMIQNEKRTEDRSDPAADGMLAAP